MPSKRILSLFSVIEFNSYCVAVSHAHDTSFESGGKREVTGKRQCKRNEDSWIHVVDPLLYGSFDLEKL